MANTSHDSIPQSTGSLGDVVISIESLWPHAPEQISRLNGVLDRLRDQKGLIDRCIDLFKELERVENNVCKDYRKSLKLLALPVEPPPAPVPAGLTVASSAMLVDDDVVGKGVNEVLNAIQTIADQHAYIARTVRTNVLKRLEEISAAHQKNIKDVRGSLDKEVRAISRVRNETLSAIHAHIKADKLVNIRQGNSGDLVDPWLTENALHFQLLDMVSCETQFSEAALGLLQAARECERLCLAGLKSVVAEFIDLQVAHSGQTRELATHLQRVVAEYDVNAAFDHYAAQTNLLNTPAWNALRTVRDFGYHGDNKALSGATGSNAIMRQGTLQRLGTIRKSRWKPSWFVLTQSGFLHCFEAAQQPFLLPPSPAAVSSGTAAPARVARRNSTYRSNSKAMFSICLRQKRCNVQYVPSKPFENCFEVSVQPPRESGLFTMGRKDVNVLIKAASEEEMVDWVCAIKKVIATYAPKAPPEPIFKSPERVKEMIEESDRNLDNAESGLQLS